MPHALEPLRQHVAQEAAAELHGVERHRAEAVALLSLPAEGDLAVLQSDQAPVGDSHRGVLVGEVLQDVLGLAQGLLRIDDPGGTPESPRKRCQAEAPQGPDSDRSTSVPRGSRPARERRGTTAGNVD